MRVNIYIRQEDEDKWVAVEDKPQFIHDSLNPLSYMGAVPIDTGTQGTQGTQDFPTLTSRNKDLDFCKHGAVKGLCKKGCK